jgi:hypothetical protein
VNDIRGAITVSVLSDFLKVWDLMQTGPCTRIRRISYLAAVNLSRKKKSGCCQALLLTATVTSTASYLSPFDDHYLL